MSHESESMGYAIAAANDFRALLYRVVDIGGDLSVVSGTRALGIVQTPVNSGQHMGLGYFGVLKAVAGAAITTPGYPLTTAASGYVIAAVSGSHVIGRFIQPGRTSLTAAASGDQITGLFNFANARPIGAGSGYV